MATTMPVALTINHDVPYNEDNNPFRVHVWDKQPGLPWRGAMVQVLPTGALDVLCTVAGYTMDEAVEGARFMGLGVLTSDGVCEDVADTLDACAVLYGAPGAADSESPRTEQHQWDSRHGVADQPEGLD